MSILHWIIVAAWLVFIAYWAIAAVGAKRNVTGTPWWTQIAARFAIVVLVLIALRVPLLSHELRAVQIWQVQSVALGILGAALTVLGVGVAVLARTYLGRNWGMPMSRKQDPELVTGGPYAFVRHPIYSGITLMMLGSAIGGSIHWMLPLVLAVAYFAYSARREEELMRAQFPDAYPHYMRRTWMLVPFVL
jgi:protein-S-isoprenylcysteine O-methyltransferase Ste14